LGNESKKKKLKNFKKNSPRFENLANKILKSQNQIYRTKQGKHEKHLVCFTRDKIQLLRKSRRYSWKVLTISCGFTSANLGLRETEHSNE
jgi:hypothetical protein